MPKQSAGILLYKFANQELQVLLVHPGGPYFKNKEAGYWTIPKGEFTAEENPLDAAQREFHEETGQAISGPFYKLAPVKQRGGKWVHAWATEGDLDPQKIRSNTFTMEWPPRSGRQQEFPEIDKAKWFSRLEALEMINSAQCALVEELVSLIGHSAE